MTAAAIGVVAHLDRAITAQRLGDAVDAHHVAYDDGSLGCEGNHRRVWTNLADTTAAWSVVLEDDALPVDGFTAQLDAALAATPAPIVSLYLGRLRPLGAWQSRILLATREAGRTGAHWILSNHCLHAVGLAIRTDLVPSMLDTTAHCGLVADDAITYWAQQHTLDIAYTWPSLVDHSDAPTLTQHWDRKARPPGRVAWATGTRKTWNSRTVQMRGHRLQRTNARTR